jgi:phenylpropionate dioxygenase-like ring-hydroxylating dioxygenase large terminal subunit
MKPICLSRQIKVGKKFQATQNLWLTRNAKHQIVAIPQTCPHLGLDLISANARLMPNCIVCPYHGRHISYETTNLVEHQGVVFSQNSTVSESQIGNLGFVSPFEFSQPLFIKSEVWRSFEFATNWRNLVVNVLDYEHVAAIHHRTIGFLLSNPIREIDVDDHNHLWVRWEAKSTMRPNQVDICLNLDKRMVLQKVPFQDTFLYSLNLVVETGKNQSRLLLNSWFEREELNNNLWMRFCSNRIIDLLVWEDQQMLKHVKTTKPKLQFENNPLIKRIYDS